MSDFQLYGGTAMTAAEVDASADRMPIRDASLIGNAKHRYISIAQLQVLFGGGAGAGQVVISASNPTTSDISLNTSLVWYNTNLNEVYNWANIGGVLYRSTVWSPVVDLIFAADSIEITADSTFYTADAWREPVIVFTADSIFITADSTTFTADAA